MINANFKIDRIFQRLRPFWDQGHFEIKGILMVLVALLKIKAFFWLCRWGFFQGWVIFMINVIFKWSHYLSINFTLFKFAVHFDHDFWFFRRPSFFINFALFYFCHFWSITLLLKKAQNQDFPRSTFYSFACPFLSKSGFTVKDQYQG